MAENSKIQWTSHTFNHVRGCTKVSAGCKNCYAETMSGRNPKTLGVWGPNGTRVVAAESYWREPLKWNKAAACSCGGGFRGTHSPYCPQANRPRVFCASLADVFEDWQGPMVDASGQPAWFAPGITTVAGGVYWIGGHKQPNPDVRPLTMQDVRRRLFALIDATPNLDWLLLTKRPENIARMMPQYAETTTSQNVFFGDCARERGLDPGKVYDSTLTRSGVGIFRKNLWLGTSVENQAAADERIPHLLRVPAAVRFLSCEPLLSQVILHKYLAQCRCGHGHGFTACPNTGGVSKTCHRCDCRQLRPLLDWVIVGGESGHDARPCRVEWVRDIVQQCKTAGVPVFVKQVGGFVVDRNDRGFEAENVRWAEGPLKDQPTDPEAWPTPVDVEYDLNGTRDGYQGAPVRVHLADRKGGNPAEWPFDLRVREFPTPNLERQPS